MVVVLFVVVLPGLDDVVPGKAVLVVAAPVVVDTAAAAVDVLLIVVLPGLDDVVPGEAVLVVAAPVVAAAAVDVDAAVDDVGLAVVAAC